MNICQRTVMKQRVQPAVFLPTRIIFINAQTDKNHAVEIFRYILVIIVIFDNLSVIYHGVDKGNLIRRFFYLNIRTCCRSIVFVFGKNVISYGCFVCRGSYNGCPFLSCRIECRQIFFIYSERADCFFSVDYKFFSLIIYIDRV